MSRTRVIAVAAAMGLALASVGVAAQAQAQTASRPGLSGGAVVDSTADRQQPRRGLQWNADGRWGLNLDVEQPVGREADWNDVDATASYRLTPSLRLRGSVGLGEGRPDPARPAQPERDQPRVRLETIFRF